MKRAELNRLTRKPESATLEFKRSTAELDRAVETLVAFLNAKGGTVLIGVRGDGTADGIEVSGKTRQQVAAAIRQIEPAGGR
jgi:ATP-dependent DNA helicase RecG